MLARLALEHAEAWPRLKRGIDAALRDIRKVGYCSAQWQAGMTAVAVPLPTPGGGPYALNLSFPAALQERDDGVAEHAALLLTLALQIQKALDDRPL